MESSEEDDDFPSINGSIIPQSKIDSLHQSLTEKGIRKLCFELLDLKDAVETLRGNMRTKYLAFLRISDEVGEMKHELMEMRKHISSHSILIQDVMTGVCHDMEQWNRADGDFAEVQQEPQSFEFKDFLTNEVEDSKITFLDKVDLLLAEHKVDEALEAMDAEEKTFPDLKGSGEASSAEASYRSEFLKRKAKLEDQLVEIAEQPSVSISEMKKALCGIIKLGKGHSAHHLLLKFFRARLQKSIEFLVPSSTVCPKVFPATLSRLVFSTISTAKKESGLLFGDDPVYSSKVVQWAEVEMEYFLKLVKESAASSDTVSALRAASVCVQDSIGYCLMLDSQGLKLLKLLLVLLRPYIEEVLESNFRRARRVILDLTEIDESLELSSTSPLSTFAMASNILLVESGTRFIQIIEDIMEQLTPFVVLHFGGNILMRISHMFGKYIDMLIKTLPGPSDDENLVELKEAILFRAETDSEQLAVLGIAFTILDELLPNAVVRGWNSGNESNKQGSESTVSTANSSPELKDWKRQLQHAFDKLRDHFCLQYVLSFIYSREGETQLNARIYVSENGEDLYWESDPLPSLPFQALFAKLQQLAAVAGDVLLGKEKLQKILLARLTETVVMWLSDEQDFWAMFENKSPPLQPLRLQQLILDMHFTVEIARFAGYPYRHIQQIASAIIARVIRTFSARGIDPQSALPPEEWFVNTANSAINKLLMVASGSEASETDDDHIIMHEDMGSDSEETTSSLSTVESFESFASASMAELESPVYTDPEG